MFARAALVLTVVAGVAGAACGSYWDSVPPPDTSVKPEGKGWWCTIESSGMLSVCERTRTLCKRARRYLTRQHAHRGEDVRFARCFRRAAAYCYTATRRHLEHAPEDERDLRAVAEEEEEEGVEVGDPRVVAEKVWLCHATPDNCAANRDNLYQAGFTDVSRCRRWK